jgi:hypothetical protein
MALYQAYESTQEASNGQDSMQGIQNEFQQLGQDLQAGNLTQAQQDFATLTQDFAAVGQTNNTANTANTGNNPIAQAFSALSQDLQNGNLSQAQQDFATIEQDFQQQGSGEQVHHHHHHGGGGGQEQSQINQAFSSLEQALNSNDLSGAQSAFTTLQQDLQQLTQGGASATAAASQTNSGLNVTA